MDHILKAIINSHIIIAYDFNNIGFISYNVTNECFVGFDYSPIAEKYIWILYVWVSSECRNKGTAKLLYEYVKNHGSKLEIKKIWLDIYNSNTKSIEYHTKLGFIPEITLYVLNM